MSRMFRIRRQETLCTQYPVHSGSESVRRCSVPSTQYTVRSGSESVKQYLVRSTEYCVLGTLVLPSPAFRQPVPLHEDFRNLYRVGRCPFAKIISHHPKIEAMRHRRIAADPADEDLVPARG